jgi:hypothetical protein
MKYLESFSKFESLQLISENITNVNPYDVIMGKLLYLYSSIPVPKQKASVALSLMIGKPYTLTEDINFNDSDVPFQDKIRIIDYLNSLLKNTEIRGDNFEGFLCGLYGGTLSPSKSSKHDLTIGGVDWSVKYTEFGDYNPEIGSFKNILKNSNKIIRYEFGNGYYKDTPISSFVREYGGLTNIFRNKPNVEIRDERDQKQWDSIKNIILDEIFNSPEMVNFGGVITGTTNVKIPKEGNPLDSITEIILNIIDKDKLRELFFNGMVNQPKKGGSESPYILRLKNTYKNSDYSTVRKITLPIIPTLEELKDHYSETERKGWAQDVFGKFAWKIRPDVLNDIKLNRKNVITKLSYWDSVWDKEGEI